MDIKVLTSRRRLAWPACYNARDLGGLPTRDGQQTRWRSIIRSDYLNRLTDPGRQAVLDYGVRTVIDLRGPQEIANEPAIPVEHGGRRLDYINLPIEKLDPHVSALIRQAKTHIELYRLILDHYPDAVAEILRAIAHAQPGGVVIHCQAGKDRTGIIVALLLSLAGVPAEVIAADYAHSQACLWPLYEKMVAEDPSLDPESFWVRPVATEDTMYLMLDHLDARYGGAENYLSMAGLSRQDIDRLKRRLLAG